MQNQTFQSSGILSRDFAALARLISEIENRQEPSLKKTDEIYHLPLHSHVIGITGLPGSGKSTIVNRLISHLVKEDKYVAVLAIDPTSPFSGGAVLGDRIRYSNHEKTAGRVFFRSMASRGHQGGISDVTADIIRVFNAAQFDYVLVETVGSGQLEVDITWLVDTLLNVTTPDAGDDIQAIKAGLMEIGDIFVVNKSDLPGADRKAAQIEMLLHDLLPGIKSKNQDAKWAVPVHQICAERSQGIEAVIQSIRAHKGHSATRDTEQIIHELDREAARQSLQFFQAWTGPDWKKNTALDIREGRTTPRRAVQDAICHFRNNKVNK